jgi:hypothetical protein
MAQLAHFLTFAKEINVEKLVKRITDEEIELMDDQNHCAYVSVRFSGRLCAFIMGQC